MDGLWLGLLVGVIVLIGIVVWWWKKVNPPPPPPSLTLATDKPSYIQGETAVFSGALTQEGEPLTGKTVSIAVTPPSGDGFTLSAVTDATGAYSTPFIIPATGPTGSWAVQAAYPGAAVASATFITTQPKQSQHIDTRFSVCKFLS